MRRKEFLRELGEHLVGISKEDKEDILEDYEEHFVIGKKKKRSEGEIARSLGEPRLIARDIRKELSREKGKGELKDEAIETYVAGKKFAKSFFVEVRDRFEDFGNNLRGGNFGSDSDLILLVLVLGLASLIFGFFGELVLFLLIAGVVLFIFGTRNSSRKNKKRVRIKSSGKVSVWKLALVLAFNIFFFLGVWLACLIVILGGFIAGLALLVSGAALICVGVFALVKYNSEVIYDIIISGLFAGAGFVFLSSIFIFVFENLMRVFFRLSKAYLDLNSRLIRR